MPVQDNECEEYEESSRQGAFSESVTRVMKTLYNAEEDNLYTIDEIIKKTNPADTRDTTAKTYKAGEKGFKAWFLTKLKVLCAIGVYGKKYNRPAYLKIKLTKTGVPCFKLTELGRAKMEEIYFSQSYEEEGEETHAQKEIKKK